MDIKLTKPEYNLVFGLLNQITAPAGSVVIANKIIEQIRSKVDEGKAEEIKLEVEPYQLEGVLAGIKAFVQESKVNSDDIYGLKSVAKALKIGKALDKALDELAPAKESSIEIDSDIVVDD